jgi:hypothetical protein
VQTVALTGLARSHNHGTPVYWKTRPASSST